MKNRIVSCIIICIVCAGLCGCSWVQSISEDDTRAIASYSAKLVAKYNIRQIDGIVYLDDEDKKKLEESESNTSDNKSNDETGTNNSTSSNSPDTSKTLVSLASALGLSGVDFTYLGHEIRDDYSNSVYDMRPNSGNKFLVMRFLMTNNTGSDEDINIISLNPKFKATINGTSSSNNDLTLIAEDLATYKGTLKASESKELVILFQFANNDLTNISSTSLQCTLSGSTNDITL